MIIEITEAKYLDNYKIQLFFSDKKEQIINFEPFLIKAKNPKTKKYIDKNLFENFTVQYGDLIWNDYEMCFPNWNLYNGEI